MFLVAQFGWGGASAFYTWPKQRAEVDAILAGGASVNAELDREAATARV